MVLEHVEDPPRFWRKLEEILKPGGVFWGFTIDSRHWFAAASRTMKFLRVKDLYLSLLHHQEDVEEYINYPVFYRCNTPRRIEALSTKFTSQRLTTFHRVGQMDYYFPAWLRWAGRVTDRATIGLGLPGSVLIMRIQK